jgi:hypothetical protein
MREHSPLIQSPGEAAAFWLNLGSKAEGNELCREWRPVPRTNLWKLREFVVADLDVERR